MGGEGRRRRPTHRPRTQLDGDCDRSPVRRDRIAVGRHRTIRIGDDELPLIGAIEPRVELFSDPTGVERLSRWTELMTLLEAMGTAEAVDDHDLAHESENTEVVVLCAPASRAVFSETDVAATRIVEEPANLRADVATLISSTILLARTTAATDRQRTARAEATIVLREVQEATERVLAVAGSVALNAVWRLISKGKRRAA